MRLSRFHRAAAWSLLYVLPFTSTWVVAPPPVFADSHDHDSDHHDDGRGDDGHRDDDHHDGDRGHGDGHHWDHDFHDQDHNGKCDDSSHGPRPTATATARARATATARATVRPTAASCPTFWGPQKFTRTTGPKNEFHVTVTAPSSVASPFTLHVQNGEADGSHRVSSATIEINDVVVASPSDFNQNVAGFDRAVTLTPTTRVDITLASAPGSYLWLNLCGGAPPTATPTRARPTASATTPPPTATATQTSRPPTPTATQTSRPPTPTATQTTAPPTATATQPRATATATETVPPPTATATQTTAPPTATATQPRATATATETVPPPTATATQTTPPPTATATETSAPPTATATSTAPPPTATVTPTLPPPTPTPTPLDVTPPTIHIDQPTAGALIGTSSVNVTISYADDRGLDLASFALLLDGAPTTTPSAGQDGAAGVIGPVADGAHTLAASIRDLAGHPAQHEVPFTVDTTAPVVVITSPESGTVTSATGVTVTGTVTDASSVTVLVEGIAADVSAGICAGGACTYSFTAANVPLGNGPHVVLHAVATDAAAHPGSAQVTLRIDRTAPDVHITSPSDGAYVRGPMLDVAGTVHDDSMVVVKVNDQTAFVPDDTFSAQIPVSEGALKINAVATDAAGNLGTATIDVVVDSMAPVITITTPASGLITNATSVHVVGTVTDTSPTTLTLGGADVPLSGASFALDAPLGGEGTTHLQFAAVDAAGNPGSLDLPIVVDRTPPDLQVTSPAEGAIVGGVPVVVQGFVTDASPTTVTVDGVDATLTQHAWQVVFTSLPEGPHTFTIVATDAADNPSTITRHVTLDLTPPVVKILQPPPGTLTRLTSIDVTGTVQTISSATVKVNGVDAVVTNGTFAASNVPLAVEGDNEIVAHAVSAAGRPASDSVFVTRDTAAPSPLLAAPATLVRGKTGTAKVTFDVDTDVDQVVLSFTCTAGGCAGSATLPAAPFTIDIPAPSSAASGDLIQVVAVATDHAGNTSAPVSKNITIVGAGVLVGQVLDDATGLPIEGAQIDLACTGACTTPLSATTDERGRYSIATDMTQAVLTAGKNGRTIVYRDLALAYGAGTSPVDARLTTLAPPVAADATGHVQAAADLSLVTTPSVSVQLTRLSPQGLPALLPLGWTPLAAADVHTNPPAPFSLTFTLAPVPSSPVHVAEYRPSLRAWVMVAANVAAAADGSVTVALPEPGAYAVLAADAGDPPVPVAAVGEPLTGVAAVAMPDDATATSTVTPPVIPPSGGTARLDLSVLSPAAMPSGTVLQAEVAETYELATGDKASPDARNEDLILYRAPDSTASATHLTASVPMTPSRTFGPTELLKGSVQMTTLSGRELARGTPGGNEPATVETGPARLTLPAKSLPFDTAVAISMKTPETFFPPAAGIVPLAQVEIDLADQTLTAPAELSIAQSACACAPGDTILVARAETIGGVTRMVVMAMAAVVGDRAVTQAMAGLPGVITGGRYVFYKTMPVGFASGTTQSSAGSLKASVTTPSLPFVSYSTTAGTYIVPALPGAATLTAVVPRTSLVGTANATVVVGQTATAPIALVGAVTTALVTLPGDATNVEVNGTILVTSPVALDPTTVTTSNVKLTQAGTPVALRFVLSGSGKTLSVIPTAALAYSKPYLFQASGLVDVFGGSVVVPDTSFRTKDNVPPVYDVSKLQFSMPDASGLVAITAPLHTFPPGTNILIVNSGNGVVLSLRAGNDGEVNGLIEASINDELLVTITDPFGNTTTFKRTQYVGADGTTAVGTAGGVVAGPPGSGIEMRIPDGALAEGVTFKIDVVTPPANEPAPNFIPDDPSLPAGSQGYFGSALKITASKPVTFKQEAKLAFPVPPLPPDAPATIHREDGTDTPPTAKDAYYYVVEKTTDSSGHLRYKVVDFATVEGEGDAARVVTASPPFQGLAAIGAALGDGGGAFFGIAAIEIMWATFNRVMPGRPLPIAVTGKVLEPVFTRGQVTYQPVIGADVLVTRADGSLPTGGGTPPTCSADWQSSAFYFTSAVVKYGCHNYTARSDGAAGPPVGKPSLWTDNGACVDSAQCANAAPYYASSQPDGTFTLWNNYPGGGPYTATATARDGRTGQATVYQMAVADTKTIGLGLYSQVLTANIVLEPAATPAPAPLVEIHVMTTDTGARRESNGLVLVNTPLTVGFRSQNGDVAGATINGEAVNVQRPDPEGPPSANNPLGMDSILDQPFVPTQVGTYTIVATAIPVSGTPVQSSYTFRAIAAGGGTTESIPGPPRVITAQTVPADDARGVLVSINPQITFTEPVKGVSTASVQLVGSDGQAVPLKISGVGVDASGQPYAIDSVSSVAQVVTSLTLVPLSALRYGNQEYTIRVTGDIVDIDKDASGNPTPNALADAPYTSTFRTFSPETLGGSTEPDDQKPRAAGIAAFGNRAYIASTNNLGGIPGYVGPGGHLRIYDLNDPAAPREMSAAPGPVISPTAMEFPPQDLASEEQPDGRRLLAVPMFPKLSRLLQGTEGAYYYDIISSPSNIYIYDVTEPDDWPKWIGAVSVSNDLVDGYVQRAVMKDNKVYTATWHKGFQVIDVSQTGLGVPDLSFAHAPTSGPGRDAWFETYRSVNQAVFHEGINQSAVLQTIPVPDPSYPGVNSLMYVTDIKVGDYVHRGFPARFIVGTSNRPTAGLIIGKEGSSTLVWEKPVADLAWADPQHTEQISSFAGYAVALGRFAGRNVALLGGLGTTRTAGSGGVLVVVDLGPLANPLPTPQTPTPAPPTDPQILAVLPLPTTGSDILIKGNTAIVSGGGRATLVDLTDPMRPMVSGNITGVGSRLALGNEGTLLLSTDAANTKGVPDPLNGVRTAALDTFPLVSIDPPYALIDDQGKTAEDLKVTMRVVPPGPVSSPTLKVADSRGTVLYSGPVSLSADGIGEITVPRGQAVKASPNSIKFEVRNPDGSSSGPVAGSGGLTLLPPVLTNLAPASAVVFSGSFTLTLHGTGFGPGAEVGFNVEDVDPTYKPAQYVSTQEIRVDVPVDLLGALGTIAVRVRVFGQLSNTLPLRVVPPGLPPAPVFQSIEPMQVLAGADAFSVTLRGAGFDSVDSLVFVDAAGSALSSTYVSSTELRALVPAGLVLFAGPLRFQVVSLQTGLASDAVKLDVLNVSTGAPIVSPPAVASIDPAEVPYVPEGSGTAEKINVSGTGFQSGAQVFATVDDAPPTPLVTQRSGDTELSCQVPAAIWSPNSVTGTFSFVAQSTGEERSDSATVQATTPEIFFTDLRSKENPAADIRPATFFDRALGQYLVDAKTGKAKKTGTFDLDVNSFLIHIREPRQLDPNALNVVLSSEKDGSVVDSMQAFDKKLGHVRGVALRGSTSQYYESANRINAVTDTVDDGKDVMEGGGKFSPNDGAPNDQTIRIEPGGTLKVVYTADPGFPREATIDVCPASQRLKIALKLYRVDGISAEVPAIRAAFQEAQRVWSQLCVELDAGQDAAGNVAITSIPEPSDKRPFGLLADTTSQAYWADSATGNDVRCDGANDPRKYPKGSTPPVPAVCLGALKLGKNVSITSLPNLKYNRMTIPQAMQDLINAAPLAQVGSALRIIFVDYFLESDGKRNELQTGKAITDTDYYVDLPMIVDAQHPFQAVSPTLTGVDFIATGKMSNGERFTGRTLAHEIAHIIVGGARCTAGDSWCSTNDPYHVTEQPNILRAGDNGTLAMAFNAILRKRFNGRQIDLLCHATRYVQFPAHSICTN